jgi:4-amino-4-deoxy-L-arabinose transferase-like glycosyltransferase
MVRQDRYIVVYLGVAGAYLAFNALTRGLASSTVDADFAEQLLLSQNWLWGYTGQPPLYTWIVAGVFALTGPHLASLLAIKVVLLTLLLAALLGAAHELGLDRRGSLIALLGFAFIPTITWEAQRDLTHTVLVTAMAALTLFVFLRLARKPAAGGYAFLGVALGLGLLSKYNYALFPVALGLAAMSVRRYRAALLSPWLGVSVMLACVIFLPHALWAWDHAAVATHNLHKIKPIEGASLAGLGSLSLALLTFMGPVLFGAPLLVRRGQTPAAANADARRLLVALGLAAVLVLTTFVLASGAQQIKNRWLQPLLFFVPLLLALYAAPTTVALRGYVTLAVLLLALTAVALPGRILLAEPVGRSTKANIPYAALAKMLRTQAGSPDLIIAENGLLGGNMRLAFPEARVLTPYTPDLGMVPKRTWLILSESGAGFKGQTSAWLKRRFAAEVPQWRRLERQYYYVPSRKHVLYWARIDNTAKGIPR